MLVVAHWPLPSDADASCAMAVSLLMVEGVYPMATAPYVACGKAPELYSFDAPFTSFASVLMRCTLCLAARIGK